MPYQYPGQMFDHTLTPLKGWPRPWAVDIEGTLSANVNIGGVGTPPLSGQVVHVASLSSGVGPNGNGPNKASFEMGANLTKMGLFLWPNFSDFDVSNPGVPAGVPLGGNAANPPGWIPIRPTGVLVALVATGAYELETTEFDTTQTYLPNQLLRAVTSNTDANAGKLTNQNATAGQGFGSPGLNVYAVGLNAGTGADSIVGVVSRGAYTNANGKSALAFWPVYLPGTR